MHDIEIVVMPNGVQKGKLNVLPLPFDLGRDVLSGYEPNPKLTSLLVNLCLKDMFPETSSRGLFNWDTIKPHEAVSYVVAYHTINDAMNKKAIREGRTILPVTGEQFSNRIQTRGFMTPKAIQSSYIPGMEKPSI